MTTSGTPSGDQAHSVFVNGILLTKCILMLDSTWPANLILDRSKSNWEDWNLCLSYVVDRQAFIKWLDGSIPCPDLILHTRGAQIWKINDQALWAFILEHISRINLDFVCRLGTAHEVYEKLHKCHKQIGLHAQVLLIKEALNVHFQHNTPLVITVNKIK